MKKITVLLLVFVLIFSFAACHKKGTDKKPAEGEIDSEISSDVSYQSGAVSSKKSASSKSQTPISGNISSGGASKVNNVSKVYLLPQSSPEPISATPTTPDDPSSIISQTAGKANYRVNKIDVTLKSSNQTANGIYKYAWTENSCEITQTEGNSANTYLYVFDKATNTLTGSYEGNIFETYIFDSDGYLTFVNIPGYKVNSKIIYDANRNFVWENTNEDLIFTACGTDTGDSIAFTVDNKEAFTVWYKDTFISKIDFSDELFSNISNITVSTKKDASGKLSRVDYNRADGKRVNATVEMSDTVISHNWEKIMLIHLQRSLYPMGSLPSTWTKDCIAICYTNK